jgi:glutamate-1-semialdehyde 2,1-aminomutase
MIAEKNYDWTKSRLMFEKACESIAGGADSTMRVMTYQIPLVIERGEGAYVWDVDGNKLIDMNMGYGPLIFGHRHPLVLNAIEEEFHKRGTVLGFAHELSHKTAELIKKSFPSIEKLRFTSSGTESIQTAVRLARHFTKRKAIILFEGHYHGSSDSVFHAYHEPLESLEGRNDKSPRPGTNGMGGAPYNTYVLPWNDLKGFESFLNSVGDTIACVIMEPVMGNSGVIPPIPGFLKGVREATQKHGILLIFDEIISGYRVARGGAQERYGVQSDLTTLSKAMNGGVPCTAIGGRGEILDLLSRQEVFHGGVYSGNPMCLSATYAVQKEYERNHKNIYDHLEKVSNSLANGLIEIFDRLAIPVCVQNVGAMLSLWFKNDEGDKNPTNYREVLKMSNAEKFIQFQHILQDHGVFIHPNHFEPCFLSTAHTQEIIDEVLNIADDSAKIFKSKI